jgi:quercetin dioxygenase-like cupin family protein
MSPSTTALNFTLKHVHGERKNLANAEFPGSYFRRGSSRDLKTTTPARREDGVAFLEQHVTYAAGATLKNHRHANGRPVVSLRHEC